MIVEDTSKLSLLKPRKPPRKLPQAGAFATIGLGKQAVVILGGVRHFGSFASRGVAFVE